MEFILRLVALVGAIAHVFFFYKEALKWDVPFVKMAAPSWVERVGGGEKAIPYVATKTISQRFPQIFRHDLDPVRR